MCVLLLSDTRAACVLRHACEQCTRGDFVFGVCVVSVGLSGGVFSFPQTAPSL